MKRLNVVLVDDNQLELSSLKDICNVIDSIGEVKAYSSSLKFLEDIKNGGRYDLYLFDIEMPGLNGAALVDETRKICSNAQIVFTSGYSKHSTIGISKDVRYSLSKPIEMNELEMVIQKLEGSNAFGKPEMSIELHNVTRNRLKMSTYYVDRSNVLLVSSFDINSGDNTKNNIYINIKGEDHTLELKNCSVVRFEKEHRLLSDEKSFFKINSSCIIHRDCMLALVQKDEILIKVNSIEKEVTLSNDYRESFMSWLKKY